MHKKNFSQTGADMRVFQVPMEPSELHRGGLELSRLGTLWNPAPGEKGKMSDF